MTVEMNWGRGSTELSLCGGIEKLIRFSCHPRC